MMDEAAASLANHLPSRKAALRASATSLVTCDGRAERPTVLAPGESPPASRRITLCWSRKRSASRVTGTSRRTRSGNSASAGPRSATHPANAAEAFPGSCSLVGLWSAIGKTTNESAKTNGCWRNLKYSETEREISSPQNAGFKFRASSVGRSDQLRSQLVLIAIGTLVVLRYEGRIVAMPSESKIIGQDVVRADI